jgi:hypothetical protein
MLLDILLPYFSGHGENTSWEVADEGYAIGSSYPAFRHNCVYANGDYNYSGTMTDPTNTDGNISQDPQVSYGFMNDCPIGCSSPCTVNGGIFI